jgi:hypothetical protein
MITTNCRGISYLESFNYRKPQSPTIHTKGRILSFYVMEELVDLVGKYVSSRKRDLAPGTAERIRKGYAKKRLPFDPITLAEIDLMALVDVIQANIRYFSFVT